MRKIETTYYIHNGYVKAKRFNNRNVSGKRVSGRIGVIIEVSNITISDLARIVSSGLFVNINHKDNDNVYKNENVNINKDKTIKVYKSTVSLVLSGIRNTKRYIDVIEKVWGLPIEDIRRFYKEDREKALTKEESSEFSKWYYNNRRLLG